MNEDLTHNEKLHVEGMRRIYDLAKTEAFRWFLREAVQGPMDLLDTAMKQQSITHEERASAVAKWNALSAVRNFFDEQAGLHGRALGHDAKSPLDIAK